MNKRKSKAASLIMQAERNISNWNPQVNPYGSVMLATKMNLDITPYIGGNIGVYIELWGKENSCRTIKDGNDFYKVFVYLEQEGAPCIVMESRTCKDKSEVMRFLSILDKNNDTLVAYAAAVIEAKRKHEEAKEDFDKSAEDFEKFVRRMA